MKAKVFVSYSHRDASYLASDSLLGYLRGLEHEGVDFWTDESLVAGEVWNELIRNRISESDILLALVSQWFLDSTYCRDVEVASFLARAREGGLVVVPVILSACEWQESSWLNDLQVIPRGGETLEEHYEEPGRRKRIFLEIRRTLRTHVHRIRQLSATSSPIRIEEELGKDLGNAKPRGHEVEAQATRAWTAELLEHGGWHLSLQLGLNNRSCTLKYTRSLSDQSISIDGESILSEFSLPLSNDAISTHEFEISDGAASIHSRIDVRHRHMTIVGFRLSLNGAPFYVEGAL